RAARAAGSGCSWWSTWRARWAAWSRRATGPRAVRSCGSRCRWRRWCSTRRMGAMEAERRLLIVEDDAAFARTLGRSFERRGYAVASASSLEQAEALVHTHSPGYAVVDLKLNG